MRFRLVPKLLTLDYNKAEPSQQFNGI